MARPLRIQYRGAFYHVTARGNERKKIFFNTTDYNKFREYVKQSQEKHRFVLHAYVLMSNHIHLLIETPEGNLSRVMHTIISSYTTYFNKKRRRAGHLFQGRYKAILIEKDSYLLELSRYIHLNPVKAKTAERPEGYPFSSYRSYITPASDAIVSRDLILSMISLEKKKAPSLYKSFVEQGLTEEIKNPFEKVYGGMILGTKLFIQDSLKKLAPETLHKKDVSARRQLHALLSLEEIVHMICSILRISPEEINGKHNRMRSFTITALKKLTSYTNSEIGQFFGGLSYSAVSKIVERFEGELDADKELRKRYEKIKTDLSNVKG